MAVYHHLPNTKSRLSAGQPRCLSLFMMGTRGGPRFELRAQAPCFIELTCTHTCAVAKPPLPHHYSTASWSQGSSILFSHGRDTS